MWGQKKEQVRFTDIVNKQRQIRDLNRFEKDTDRTYAACHSTRAGCIDRKMCDERCSERCHQSGEAPRRCQGRWSAPRVGGQSRSRGVTLKWCTAAVAAVISCECGAQINGGIDALPAAVARQAVSTLNTSISTLYESVQEDPTWTPLHTRRPSWFMPVLNEPEHLHFRSFSTF